jgi:hypothetical protein
VALSPRRSARRLAREALELPEVAVARGQDQILDPTGFEIANALDDLRRGAREVRLLQVLERPAAAHHALEERALEPAARLLAIGRVDQPHGCRGSTAADDIAGSNLPM